MDSIRYVCFIFLIYAAAGTRMHLQWRHLHWRCIRVSVAVSNTETLSVSTRRFLCVRIEDVLPSEIVLLSLLFSPLGWILKI